MNNNLDTPPPLGRAQRARHFYEKNENNIAIGFFIGGFLFDMLMLERIDSVMTWGQQAAYLVIIMLGMMQAFFEQGRTEPNLAQLSSLKRWYYDYRMPAIHFFFGSLLNGYALFFFKSSSILVSFVFLVIMSALLIANESQRFKKSELTLKFGMLGLCFLCYFAYAVPLVMGFISTLVFLLSMVVGSLPLVFTGWWIQKQRPTYFELAKKQILMPMGLVLIVFLGLYSLKMIPPVPLSIPFIGVYHSVERTSEGYRLGHERPWWRFWHNGDQVFHAQRSDKVYVFFRVFSPTRFADQVVVRWYWKDNQQGWVLQDSIPIKIVGGRDEGFRGFGVKSNYQPGEWKVAIETTDEREIGRVYFTLDIAAEVPRTFEFETM